MAIPDELDEVEAVLPATWCPDLPLIDRIKRLVEIRRGFWRAFELEKARSDALQAQRDSMREHYLGLLHYALRVANLEAAVSLVLADADQNGSVDLRVVAKLAEARARLTEPVAVDPPDEALAALEPFLRGTHGRILLTGASLSAFREVVRWIHGFAKP